jgi:hypothetical protein
VVNDDRNYNVNLKNIIFKFVKPWRK